MEINGSEKSPDWNQNKDRDREIDATAGEETESGAKTEEAGNKAEAAGEEGELGAKTKEDGNKAEAAEEGDGVEKVGRPMFFGPDYLSKTIRLIREEKARKKEMEENGGDDKWIGVELPDLI